MRTSERERPSVGLGLGSDVMNVAWFITPHGFGHATRSAAIMEEWTALGSDVSFHVFSHLPASLFPPPPRCRLHPTATDVGMAQRSALHVDLGETLRLLGASLPPPATLVADLSVKLLELDCRLVVCDIAALGIEAARAAGLPSVLVENFTWDWIYEGYLEREPALEPFISRLRDSYARADFHVQTAPVCRPSPGTMRTAPIARKAKLTRAEVRARLNIGRRDRLVLITMGGIAQELEFLHDLRSIEGCHFLIPGSRDERDGNITGYSKLGAWHHPDLVRGADAVIAKLGYSTVAETWRAGVPLGFIERPHFRESPVLADFVRANLPHLAITARDFTHGDWLANLDELLALKPFPPPKEDGAASAAAFLNRILLT